MTDADAEWLRERPEIVEAYVDAFMRINSNSNIERTYAALAAILPHLRAAIRADVVRELARNSVDDLEIHKVANRFAAAEQDADKRSGPASHGKAMAKLYELIAAAHAQGRAAGREEAAKHVRQRADMFAGKNSRDSALLFAECRALAHEIDAMTTLESLP